ncbi:MAG TPA: hypothetical protein VII56_15290 [Rhizomicrobium sp.]
MKTVKLIRDKLTPADSMVGTVEPGSALHQALIVAKMHEEVQEIAADLGNVDEYGDLLELLVSLGRMNGHSLADMVAASDAKREKNGGFATARLLTREQDSV